MGLHRHGQAGRGHSPPARVPGSPCLPHPEQCHGRPGLQQRRVPHEGRQVDEGRRYGGHVGRRESCPRAANAAGDPPHDRHDQDPEQRGLGHDESGIAAADPARHQPQVVGERPVMEGAYRSQRSYLRQVAGVERRPHVPHLVTLVESPPTPPGQVHETEDCRNEEDGDQDCKLDAADGWVSRRGPGRLLTRRYRSVSSDGPGVVPILNGPPVPCRFRPAPVSGGVLRPYPRGGRG
jgi:hypothetical protein